MENAVNIVGNQKIVIMWLVFAQMGVRMDG